MFRNFVQKFSLSSKKRLVQCAVAVLVVCLCFGLVESVSQPVFANDGSVSTTFFGNIKDEGNGCGVYLVLNMVIDIMAFGVGIAAIIGIVIAGIMYLTARDNQERTVKAKRRIYEIVIGVAVYLVLWSLLSFILPGGVLNDSPQCGVGTESDPFFTTPVETPSRDNSWNHYGRTRRVVAGNTVGTTTISSETNGGTGNMLVAAKNIAALFVKNKFRYGTPDTRSLSAAKQKKGVKVDCAQFVSYVAQEAGLIKDGARIGSNGSEVKGENYLKKHFNIIKTNGSSVARLVKDGKLVPGDIIGMTKTKAGIPHTMIFAGKKNNKYYYYSGGKNATDTRASGGTYVDESKFLQNYSASCGKGSCKVEVVIHPKSS